MPDNLRITTPITTNDTVNKLRPAKESPVNEVINPAVVTPANQGEQAAKENINNALLNHTSVFTKFVQQLRQTPALAQTLQKIMFDIFSREETIQRGQTAGAALKQLSSSLAMDKGEILKNLMFQQTNHTKFSGTVFDVLRSLSAQTKSAELDQQIAKFLKGYDGFFSISDTTNAIVRQLNTLQQQIPKSYADKLKALTNDIVTDHAVESIDFNLMVLKNKIIPLLSEYVSKLNDFGKARDTITLMVHDLARLNTSSQQELIGRFEDLLDYCRFHLNLPTDKIEYMKAMFAKDIAQSNQKTENTFFDSLISILSEGSKLNASNTSQALYKDICNALLLDNSVYMPYTHLFLPINYNGHYMFSELWIEKDKDSQNKSAQQENVPKSTRLFLTFDIKELGYFEASIELTQKNANIKLSYPPTLQESSREISSNISQIFTQNGLTAENIVLSTDNTPKISQQILQKVYERKTTIDVTI